MPEGSSALNRGSPDREAAFTLLELVVALSLLTVIAVNMGAGLVSTLRANRSISDREEARIAAASQMEEVLAWADFSSLAATFDSREFAAGALQGTAGVGSMPGRVTVDSTNTLLLKVRVMVDWIGVDGDGAYEISTLLSDPTP